MKTASIGFRAKTGRAIAVAISGTVESPEFVARWQVDLSDPEIAVTVMPHHQVMELPWADAQRAVRTAECAIEKLAITALTKLMAEMKRLGFQVSAVGTVGSPDKDLSKIGNFHIRAHAAKGILFRRVLETAAEKRKLPWCGFSDRNIGTIAAAELKLTEDELKNILTKLGRDAGRPWRQDERSAAMAAWLALE